MSQISFLLFSLPWLPNLPGTYRRYLERYSPDPKSQNAYPDHLA